MDEYRLYLTSLLDGLARSGIELPDYSLETVEDLWEVASWLDKVYTFVHPLYQEGDLQTPYEFSLTDSFYDYWRAEFYKEHLGRESFSTPTVSVEPSTDIVSPDSSPSKLSMEEATPPPITTSEEVSLPQTELENTNSSYLEEPPQEQGIDLEEEPLVDLEPLSLDLVDLDLGIYEQEEETTSLHSPITGTSPEGFDLYGEPLEGYIEEVEDEEEEEDDFDYSYGDDEAEDLPSFEENDLEGFEDYENFEDLDDEDDTWGYEEYIDLDDSELSFEEVEEIEEDLEDEDDDWGYTEYLSEDDEEEKEGFTSDSTWLYEEQSNQENTSPEPPISSTDPLISSPKVNVLEEYKKEPDEPSKPIKGHPEKVLHLLGRGEASLKKFVKERWHGSDRL